MILLFFLAAVMTEDIACVFSVNKGAVNVIFSLTVSGQINHKGAATSLYSS